jgi:anthranilate phosphoribosyltransferase
MEGYDDIRPGTTVVAEWGSVRGTDGPSDGGRNDPRDGEDEAELDDFEIETANYGMDFESDDLGVEDVAADSAAITEAVVTGERDDRFADAVALNGALRMYAREDVASLADGLEAARAAIADGSAAAVLEDLRAF